MKKKEFKKILHSMIDSLDDKHILYDLKENIIPYVIKYRTKKTDKADDPLTDDQTKHFEEAIRQPDESQVITLGEFKKKFAKWLPNDSENKKAAQVISKQSKKKLRKKIHKLIDEIDSRYILNILLDDVMPDALNGANYQ